MKKILLMMAMALFAVQGFSMEKAVTSDNTSAKAILVTLDNDATLTTCQIWLTTMNGTWWLRAQYPVASNVDVVIDGPGLAGMIYTIPRGNNEYNTNIPDSMIATIAEIFSGSDGTYQYVF